eukprot:920762-Prymnesium_polylepis.1
MLGAGPNELLQLAGVLLDVQHGHLGPCCRPAMLILGLERHVPPSRSSLAEHFLIRRAWLSF